MDSIFLYENIIVDLNLNSQKEAFEKIADIAVNNGLARSKAPIIRGLKNREKESTTGFLDGFAIPHTKSKAVYKPSVIILKLKKGIEWNSLDGKPVSFIISLLIPEKESGSTHLSLLSKLSKKLMEKETRKNLLTAESAAEILSELNQVTDE